jgi:hypothetical protein
MSISSKEACEIAQKHGLSLSDAAALAKLADNTDEADDLAVMFERPEDEDPAKLAAKIERR